MRGDLRVFHAEQNLLVIVLWHICLKVGFLLNDDLLGGMLSHQGTDYTGKENHHHYTIEHDVVDEILAWRHLEAHAHHYHSDGSGSMGRSEAEHHITIGFRQPEQQTGDIGCQSLAEGSEEYDKEYCPHHVESGENGPHIDEHTHTYQEIGDEQRVADKLDAVHQRRHMGDIAVEDQSGEEGAEDAFKADG